jgi:hypothetical protein
MTLSVVLYCGVCLLLLSVAFLLKPPRMLGIPNRMTAVAMGLVSLSVVGVAALWPAPRTRTAKDVTLLSRALPQYQFEERHEIGICAPAPRILEAVRQVTAAEIRSLRLLMAIRGHAGDAPANEPLLDAGQRSGFVWLGEIPSREIALGMGVPLWGASSPDIADAGLLRIQLLSARNDPGRFAHLELRSYPKAVMHFLVKDGTGGCHRLVTRTRIAAKGSDSLWKVAIYWRLLYPGSVIVRQQWLEAIKRRAEQPE